MCKPPNLILHPGHGKCGSSSVQAVAYSNRACLEKQGIYLPDSQFRFSFENGEGPRDWTPPVDFLQRALAADGSPARWVARLEQIIQSARRCHCESILLSCENLGNLFLNEDWGQNARDFHRTLARHFRERVVIFYVRKQEDYVVSSWQQWYHKMGTSLDEYVTLCLARHQPSFLKTARFFEETYGSDALHVVPLHRESLLGKDLVSDFTTRAGIDLPKDAPRDYRDNKSLNPYLCSLLARVPSIYDSIHDNSVKDAISRHVRTRNLLLGNDTTMLSRETRRTIGQHFEEENKQLHQRYFSDRPEDCMLAGPCDSQSAGSEDEQERLERELERLKGVVSLQWEILVRLLKESDSGKSQGRPAGWLKRLAKKLAASWPFRRFARR